eukprot:126274_1
MSESIRWTYKWQITDASMIKQMKNAKNGDDWASPIFSACGFKWKLKVYTNSATADTKGNVNFFLYLVFVPPKVKSIVVEFRYGLLEVKKITNSSSTYDESAKG